MCILYWQGGDYKIQETWAHAQYLIWHKWTLSGNSSMPRVWLGDTLVSVQHEQNGSELSHSGMWAINFGKYRKGRRAQIQMYHSPSPTPAPVPAQHFQSPGRTAHGSGRGAEDWEENTAPSHEYQRSTRTTHHKDGAKLINLAYKGWQHVRKSKCTHPATRVEDKDIHPEQQIVSNIMNTSHPTGRKPAWFYT